MDRPEGDQRQVLLALAGLAREHLAASLEVLFGTCKKQFFERAKDAANESEQKQLLDFVRVTSRGKDAVTTAFLQRIAAGFERMAQPGTAAPAPLREGGLQLAEIIDSAQTRWRPELLAVRERLRALGLRPVDEHADPLDPVGMVGAFVEACAALGADARMLNQFLAQFDAHVLQTLGGLYKQANKLLGDAVAQSASSAPQKTPAPAEAAGPAPGKAKATAKDDEGWLDAYFRSGPDPTPANPNEMSAAAAALFATGRRPGAAAHDETPALSLAGTASGDALQEIAGLLQHLRGAAAAPGLAPQLLVPPGGAVIAQAGFAAVPSGPVTTISGEQLVALLSDLQAAPAGAAGAPAQAVDIRAALGAITARQGNVGVGRQDQDVLDIVTLFFDMVTEDRALPAAIQGLIARLQLPVLKLALQDRAFFTERGHPARQLIDALARAGVGWDAATREAQDSLLARLGDIVNEILTHSALGADAFRQALENLNEHVNRVDQRAQKLERRTVERAQAEARTAAARDAVHALLGERLDDRELAEPVLEFFTKDWQRVLQLLFLRKGRDSAEWKDAVQLVDELVRTAATPADAAQRADFEGALPALYERLAAGLEMTQGNTGEAQERVDKLRAMHRAQLAAPTGQAGAPPLPVRRVKIEAPPLVPPRNPAGAAPAADPGGAALTLDSLKKVDEIPVGTWFEYENPANRATRRLKLSARIEATRMFLFCDHLGNPVAEKPRKQFALEIQSGQLRAIEDTPLVDRTIDRIAASLRQQTQPG